MGPNWNRGRTTGLTSAEMFAVTYKVSLPQKAEAMLQLLLSATCAYLITAEAVLIISSHLAYCSAKYSVNELTIMAVLPALARLPAIGLPWMLQLPVLSG